MDKRVRTAAQTAVLMAILILISKCLGFIREMVMANYFGTSYITDAYVMSTTIPTVIFGGVFSAIATAYMPIYSKIVENSNEKQGNYFTCEVINLVVVVSAVSALIGLIFSDQIVSIFASGFTGETAKLTSYFLKITFSYVMFTSVIGILEAYLQYKSIFLIQIVIGYVQNIIIISVIIISAVTSHYYLALGWLAAYITRVIILIIASKKRGFNYTRNLGLNETVKRIIIVAIPVFVGSCIQQINTFVDKTLASGLVEGSIAALNYGMILIGLITGLTITILATILYPKFNHSFAIEDYNRFSELIGTGTTLVLIISIPCTLGAMVYSSQIVQVVYERGVFDPNATAMTSTAFFYYAIGLVFISINDLLIRVFYSMHDMKTPMIFAGICVIMNIVFNLILIGSMKHNGLALATSISAIANSCMLYIGMKIKYPHIVVYNNKKKFIKIVLSALFSVGISYLTYIFITTNLTGIIYMRLTQLFISVAVAGIVYLTMLIIFKVEEVSLIKEIIKR